MQKHEIENQAALAVRAAIINRKLVTEIEFSRWLVEALLNDHGTTVAVVCRSRYNSRRIECEVSASLVPVAKTDWETKLYKDANLKPTEGAMKMMVEFTAIVDFGKTEVLTHPYAEVVFDPPKQPVRSAREIIRHKRAA